MDHFGVGHHPALEVVLPNDYTTVLMRSAFIPKHATNVLNAKTFLNFLLFEEGQQVLANKTRLYPVRQDIDTNVTAKSLRVSTHGLPRPIPLDLSLLLFTDKMKRQILLEEWERSLVELE